MFSIFLGAKVLLPDKITLIARKVSCAKLGEEKHFINNLIFIVRRQLARPTLRKASLL